MIEKPKNVRAILVRPDMLVGDHNIKHYFEIERNLSYFPPLITALVFLNVAVFFWSYFTYIMNPSDNLVIEGMFQGAWLTSQPMRLYTAKFLHASFGHLFGNMALLYISGIMLEHLFGTLKLLWFYLLCCLTAGLSTYFFFDPEIASLGASGAVFGLLGLLISFFIRYHNHVFVRYRAVFWVLLIFSLHSISMGFMTTYVNNAAHLGGFLTGLLFGFILQPNFRIGKIDRLGSPSISQKEKHFSFAGVKVLILATLVPFLIMQSKLSPWGNISFWDNFMAYIQVLLNPPQIGYTPTNYWTFTPPSRNPKIGPPKEKPPGPDNSGGSCTQPGHSKGAHGHDSNGNEVSNSEDSKDSGGQANNDNKDQSGGGQVEDQASYEEKLRRAQDAQGRVCPVCIKGSPKPCKCDPKCRWTYLHHYSDENCKVKVLTNVWGPNTGSPFKMGFRKKRCIPFIDRYYSWEHPRNGCYAPLDR